MSADKYPSIFSRQLETIVYHGYLSVNIIIMCSKKRTGFRERTVRNVHVIKRSGGSTRDVLPRVWISVIDLILQA